ncbi:hypothetical protein [Roseicyclus mahoneyensis]|uniref:Translocase n=1 Tax=Roseicyclus mahoneyensis TaxID=164332 RepID=A0A316GM73_9RHOB|nr:hypothetical protein [Roseicyclus mahoneyensis]PWK61666.1 hypothetical protein C7455_102358 [Roseicyclus mahoneyensis]
MSVRKLLLRSITLAALCGSGVAAFVHYDLAATPVRAEVGAVVLTAGPAPASTPPAQPEAPTQALEQGGPIPPTAETPREDAVALSPLGLPCGLNVSAEAMPGAMVALDIIDPCAPETRVDITHGALRFSGRTDAMGLLTLDIPALETPAFFTVRLETGAEATTLAGLPDLIDHARAAITWTGDIGLQLHGYLGEATFGQTGHVWQDSPGSVADASIGAGGFLSILGDPGLAQPQLAQVFTIPRALRDDLSLVVEVPITETTCGRPVRAQSLQITPGEAIEIRPVTMTLPGCEAVGEFLMLQNLFLDLRLASN